MAGKDKKELPSAAGDQKSRSKLHDAEQLYQSVFKQSPDGILIIDTEGNFLDFNEAACRQLGYTREEFERLRLSDIDPVETDEEIQDSIRKVMENGTGEFEVKHKTKSGEIRDVRVITQSLALSGRTVFHTIWRDITERKRAEVALQESERKFRTLFESAKDALFILDQKGNFIDINATAHERLGYTKEEMLSMHLSRIDLPEYAPKLAERLDKVKTHGHAVFESAHRKKDGTVMPVEVNARIIDFGGSKAIFSIIRETTERKLAEATLKETNAKLQALIHALPDAVFFKDVHRRYLMVNKTFERITGMKEGEFIGRTDEDFMPPDIAASCRKSDDEVMRSGKALNIEDSVTPPGGEKMYLDSVKAPIYDMGGSLFGLVGVSRDITERKRTDHEIIRLNRQKELILNAAGEGIYGLDREGNITFINPAAAHMIGWRVGDLVGKPGHDVFHHSRPDGSTHPREECPVHKALTSGEVHHVKNEVFWRKDGTNFPVEYISTPITEDGKITGVVVVFKDISEQKQAEEALQSAIIKAKEEKAKTESIVAAIGDGINIQDTDYKIIYQNEVSIRFYGRHVGEYCYRAFQNKDHVCKQCHLSMAFKDGKVHTLEQKRITSRGTFYYEITASPLLDAAGKIIAGIELVREITGRKLAEERLKAAVLKANEEKARSEAIISAIGDEMVIIDPEFIIIFQNRCAVEKMGDHVGEICYQAFENRYAVCEGCPVQLSFKDGFFHRGERIAATTVGIMHLDITASPLRDAAGNIIAAVELVRDITERRRAEEALRISEERLRLALAATNQGLYDLNVQTGEGTVSPEYARMLGYDPGDLKETNASWAERLHPDDRQRVIGVYQDYLSGKEPAYTAEFRMRTGTGEWKWVLSLGKIVQWDPDGKPLRMLGTLTDITENRKLLEQLENLNRNLEERVREETEKNRAREQLMQLQSRHAAMGEMIDNIAHQWRQPLNNLGLIMQALQKKFLDGALTSERMQEQAKTGMSLIQYMSQTINDFTNFFRHDKEMMKFRVKDAVTTALSFMETTLKRNNVKVIVDIADDITVKGFRNEYTQVLVNILNNARDVFTERVIQDPKITFRAFRENSSTVLTVGDNGGGIADEVMDRIFLPYFTTKARTNGTGIGLYMSKTIIENNMNGKLSVCNKGAGAEFRVEVHAGE